jgi:hypothetical protein
LRACASGKPLGCRRCGHRLIAKRPHVKMQREPKPKTMRRGSTRSGLRRAPNKRGSTSCGIRSARMLLGRSKGKSTVFAMSAHESNAPMSRRVRKRLRGFRRKKNARSRNVRRRLTEPNRSERRLQRLRCRKKLHSP